MAKSSTPDPRFDPRFQRGYDGPQPDAPPTPAMPSPVQRARRPTPPAIAAGDEAETIAPQIVGRPAEPESLPSDEPLWSPPRRNPLAISLLIAGLAMIAVGLWLFWTVATASSYPNGNDRASQAFQLAQNQLTPALLIAGLLGIIGWLVLGALATATRKDG